MPDASTSHHVDSPQLEPIRIIYASVTGTAEQVGLRLGRELRAQGWRARVQDVASFEVVSRISSTVMRNPVTELSFDNNLANPAYSDLDHLSSPLVSLAHSSSTYPQDDLLPSATSSPSSPSYFIFIPSTTGEGDPPPSFLPLWSALLTGGLPATLLAHLRFGVFGLGDSSYSRYNWVAKKLWRRLTQLGAKGIGGEGEGEFEGLGFGDDQNEFG